VEPSLEDEVAPLVDWCFNQAPGSSYLRLVSVPTDFPAVTPEPFVVRPGWGRQLKVGKELAFVGYGPTLLAEAVKAARTLDSEGKDTGVIAFPWLNQVDPDWLHEMVSRYRTLVVIDNHYAIGGLFDRFASVLAVRPVAGLRLRQVAIDRIPSCGNAAEVLQDHGMDAAALTNVARSLLG
jgi:transketolase